MTQPRRRPVTLTWEATAWSHPGLKRPNNEDTFLCTPEKGLFAVCDGMGGARGGEVAAGMAADLLPVLVENALAGSPRPTGRELRERLAKAAVELSDRIRRAGEADRALRGMGTTLVAALAAGSVLHVVNVGDSRACLLRASRFEQLSTDHNLAGLLAGEGPVPAAVADRCRHILMQALGMAETPEPAVRSIVLQDGDRLLLCTDGLHGLVPDTLIADLLGSRPSPKDACHALIDAALSAGGSDNITVVVADVHAVAPRPRGRRA